MLLWVAAISLSRRRESCVARVRPQISIPTRGRCQTTSSLTVSVYCTCLLLNSVMALRAQLFSIPLGLQ